MSDYTERVIKLAVFELMNRYHNRDAYPDLSDSVFRDICMGVDIRDKDFLKSASRKAQEQIERAKRDAHNTENEICQRLAEKLAYLGWNKF